MSNFWSIYIALLVLGNIAALVWLLFATNKKQEGEIGTTGHEWDGIEELDTPMPRWWLWMFILSVIFGLIYFVLYPGIGSYEGTYGWTQAQQHKEQMAAVESQEAAFFDRLGNQSIHELSSDSQAMATAGRLFANHCSTCHGADARGAVGFPNLADDDWLYGSSPEQIQHSIRQGRNGVMPPFGAALGDKGVYQLSHYVVSLSRGSSDSIAVKAGAKQFATSCAMCHGADAKGNTALGAPNLTDDIWLHGRSLAQIQSVIRDGRQGKMPKHENILSEGKIHLLSAYLLSFQNDAK